ncbi:protein sym-1 [Nymphaea colorata]|nr:protein sym-1 [Nymphaea colorata]
MGPVHPHALMQATTIHPIAMWSSNLTAAGLSLQPSTSNLSPTGRLSSKNSPASFFALGSSTSFPSFPGRISRGSGTTASPRYNLPDSAFRRRYSDGFRYRWLMRVANDGSGGGNGGFGGSGSGPGSGGSGEGGGDESGGKAPSLISWYLRLLEESPVLTKALTSALLTFIGDSISQLLIERVPTWDLKRTFLFAFLGMVLVGPTLHFWYLSLSQLVSLSGVSGVFLRLLLDQFIFSPLFIGVFLSTLVVLEGRPSEVLPKLRQEWFSAVIANWQLWIPFQFLNFLFVPQIFQVLFANVVAVAWNVILSFKAHKTVTVQ